MAYLHPQPILFIDHTYTSPLDPRFQPRYLYHPQHALYHQQQRYMQPHYICHQPYSQHGHDHQHTQQRRQEQDKRRESDRKTFKVTWTFPRENYLKLNTDGSSKGNPGPSSFGGLIRDSHGRFVCGYMGKMKGKAFTSLEAEIWSIFKGLCLIKEKKLRNLIIETDCQAAVLLGVEPLHEGHPLKSIIDEINGLMMEHKCLMIHTRRDGNHCADQLAKAGGHQSEEYRVLEEPPTWLIPYLVQDLSDASKHEKSRQ